MTSPKALIMAGGTGGHVFPALAVAQELQNRGWLVDWMGTSRGLEARVVPSHQLTLHVLPVSGLRGKPIIGRIQGLWRLMVALFKALGLMLSLRPQVVLGMGGYAAGPGGLAAYLLRRPLVIHEQNAIAGTTNRLLAPLAKRVLSGLPGPFVDERRAELVGNPLRRDLEQGHVLEVPVEFTALRPLRLLVLGGSLGSLPLNHGVPAALGEMDDDQRSRISVIHQCGAQHLEATRQAYRACGIAHADIHPFIEDMGAAYAGADLVICRSGALTVSELASQRRPAILIPLPHAIDDHQTENAKALVALGAAQLLPQPRLMGDDLPRLLTGYLDSPGRLAAMSAAADTIVSSSSCCKVADVLEEVANDWR
jgi:UDP-N-acetylglucosamine--N-acetylmuramyl-(pentapeptide) pyrophosphoryl-undecaprenol N-acetylglucosamine transferase